VDFSCRLNRAEYPARHAGATIPYKLTVELLVAPDKQLPQ